MRASRVEFIEAKSVLSNRREGEFNGYNQHILLSCVDKFEKILFLFLGEARYSCKRQPVKVVQIVKQLSKPHHEIL